MPSTPRDHPLHRSIRLLGYDYSQPGAYFVTMITHGRQPLFGALINGNVSLSPLGNLAASLWRGLHDRFPKVDLDEFVVMPDHIHGIVVINEEATRQKEGVPHSLTLSGAPDLSLGVIVGSYKSTVSRLYHVMRRTKKIQIWQRNYYERIIRNDNELNHIRLYIRENPVQGSTDKRDLLWY
ncbi:MAG: transposase [Bellilinea sp.]